MTAYLANGLAEPVRAYSPKAATGGHAMAAIVIGTIDQSGWGLRLPVSVSTVGGFGPVTSLTGDYPTEIALIDTGATLCMLSDDLIGRLALQPTGEKADFHTGNGSVKDADVFRLDMLFTALPQYGTNFAPARRVVSNCESVRMPTPNPRFSLIVGMNVLQTTGLVLTPVGSFYLHI